MEDQLKRLRNSMEKTSFKHLNFSEQQRKQVHKKINESYENEKGVFIAILQLLNSEKTGYELTQLLRGRGIQKFDENEGFVYTLLHRLEQNHFIKSNWDDSGVKYYRLDNKGRKILRKTEKSPAKQILVLKELTEE